MKKSRIASGISSFLYQRLEPKQLLATINVTTTLDVVDATDGLTSLREAVIESNSNGTNDTIVIPSGTYQLSIAGINESDSQTGDLDIHSDSGSQLSIEGAGIGQTVIDGNQVDRVFELFEDANVTFRDLEITGGSELQQPANTGRRGAGIFSGDAVLQLNRVRMTGNDTGDFGVGGAIYAAGGRFHIFRSQITDNQAGSGGAAIFARQTQGTVSRSDVSRNTLTTGIRGAIEGSNAQLSISNSSLDENSAGIFTTNGSLDVEGSRFLRQADGTGPSRAILSNFTAMSINNSRFVGNGTAIRFDGIQRSLTIYDSLFHGNESAVRFAGFNLDIQESTFQRHTGSDGVIRLPRANGNVDLTARVLSVSDSTFRFNQQSGIEGEIATTQLTSSTFHKNKGRGGVEIEGNLFVRGSNFTGQIFSAGIRHQGPTLEVVDTLIQGNGNSGLFLENAGDVYISNSRIIGNDGYQGGAIRVSPGIPDSRVLISNSLLSRNRATFGGAIFVETPEVQPQIEIASSTIVQNRATEVGGVISVSYDQFTGQPDAIPDLEFRNSIVWGNQAQFRPILRPSDFNVVGFFSFFNDDAAGDGNVQFGGTANNNSDRFPGFADWAQGDFSLAASSIAINAGSNSLLERDERDVDQDLNVIEFVPDIDLKGRANDGLADIGAFEFRV